MICTRDWQRIREDLSWKLPSTYATHSVLKNRHGQWGTAHIMGIHYTPSVLLVPDVAPFGKLSLLLAVQCLSDKEIETILSRLRLQSEQPSSKSHRTYFEATSQPPPSLMLVQVSYALIVDETSFD